MLFESLRTSVGDVFFSLITHFGEDTLFIIAGLVWLLVIKVGLKESLMEICGGHHVADGLRYFLMVVFAECGWSMTFEFFVG